MLERVIERTLKAKLIDEVVIATTTEVGDGAVVEAASKLKVGTFAGSVDNVLERYLMAARKFEAQVIVRITADCPLIEPEIVDLVISSHLKGDLDYSSNIFIRTFPRGWDTEVVDLRALEKVHTLNLKPHHREHVTAYFHECPHEFKVFNVEAEGKLYRPDLRLCVDEAADLELVRTVYDKLGREDSSSEAIIDLFDRQPELAAINECVRQKVQ